MGELRKPLCLVETFLTSEREAEGRKTLDLEQEARGGEEKIHSLLEQLGLLQQELDKSQRDQSDLGGQMKVYKEETQQVDRFVSPRLQHYLASKAFPSNPLISAAKQKNWKRFRRSSHLIVTAAVLPVVFRTEPENCQIEITSSHQKELNSLPLNLR